MRSYTFTMKATVSSDAGAEVTISVAGNVLRAMLSRYSHVRMEAKRRALDEIAARQRAANRGRLRIKRSTCQACMGIFAMLGLLSREGSKAA